MFTIILTIILFGGLFGLARAHCPLCTVGAGFATGIAAWLGVSEISIGIFIGAFAVAIGAWIANIWKARFSGKKELLVIVSFATTIIPLVYMFSEPLPIYLSIAGDYGALLNRTYLINQFLLGSVLGGVVVMLTPLLSGTIKKKKGRVLWPYQGLSLTFAFLFVLSILFELWI